MSDYHTSEYRKQRKEYHRQQAIMQRIWLMFIIGILLLFIIGIHTVAKESRKIEIAPQKSLPETVIASLAMSDAERMNGNGR